MTPLTECLVTDAPMTCPARMSTPAPDPRTGNSSPRAATMAFCTGGMGTTILLETSTCALPSATSITEDGVVFVATDDHLLALRL